MASSFAEQATEAIASKIPQLTALSHDLHANPELCFAEHHAADEQHADRHEAGHELIPIAFERRTGIRDEGDAADDCREDRKSHRPRRNGAARDKIRFRRRLPPREFQADGRDCDEINRDDNEIQCAQGIHVSFLPPSTAHRSKSYQKT